MNAMEIQYSDHFSSKRTSTQLRYKRAWNWFVHKCAEDRKDIEPTTSFFQQFLNEYQNSHHANCRLIQSLINQKYIYPCPTGPPLTLLHPKKEPHKKVDELNPRHVYLFIPNVIKKQILNNKTWESWIAEYVFSLGALPLRRNQIKSYVTHVVKTFLIELCCSDRESFLNLTRENIEQTIVHLYPYQNGQRRLCRIACNHLVINVIFREFPSLAQRLCVRSVALKPVVQSALHCTKRTAPISRDHFTKEEMNVILNSTDLKKRDLLLLFIMSETGLRREQNKIQNS